MIFLKRNAQRDPWYSVHDMSIKEGEIVKLIEIRNEEDRSAKYPPEIYISRSKTTGDNYIYIASLNCYDYIGSSK